MIHLTIENGVVVNRTVGKDVGAVLSVAEPQNEGIVIGSTTSDDGVTFSPPAVVEPALDVLMALSVSKLQEAFVQFKAVSKLALAADAGIQDVELLSAVDAMAKLVDSDAVVATLLKLDKGA